MSDDGMYKRIEKTAIGLTFIAVVITTVSTHSWENALSVVLGSSSSMLGFKWIVATSNKMMHSPNASKLAVAQYMIRYILYGIIFYIGMQVGLNAIFMLIGFSALSISIKICILTDKKEV